MKILERIFWIVLVAGGTYLLQEKSFRDGQQFALRGLTCNYILKLSKEDEAKIKSIPELLKYKETLDTLKWIFNQE